MAMSKFSWGVVSGVVLGILFAPTNGAKTRKTVANVASGIKSRFNSIFRSKEDELEELHRLLSDESAPLTDADRKRLVQLVENNQKLLNEMDV